MLAFLRARSADDSRAERFPSDLCDELAAALEALEHRQRVKTARLELVDRDDVIRVHEDIAALSREDD